MTTSPDAAASLAFHVGDRMRKAQEVAGYSVASMADYLGVNPATVTRWTKGHTPPSKQTLRLWALRTGVSLEWLEGGIVVAPGGGSTFLTIEGGTPSGTRTPNPLITTRPALRLIHSPADPRPSRPRTARLTLVSA